MLLEPVDRRDEDEDAVATRFWLKREPVGCGFVRVEAPWFGLTADVADAIEAGGSALCNATLM